MSDGIEVEVPVYSGVEVAVVVGPRGLSAYQVAVADGFVGTEVEWLASLDGAPGDPGAPGDSAYAVAVANGFVGTEVEWLASLDGAPGADGFGVPDPAGATTGQMIAKGATAWEVVDAPTGGTAGGIDPAALRGAWSSASTYNTGDIVNRNGAAYLCLSDGVTGATYDPALSGEVPSELGRTATTSLVSYDSAAIIAQPFTPTASGNVSGIGIPATGSGANEVFIVAGNVTTAWNTAIASALRPMITVPVDGSGVTYVAFSTPIPVTAGSTYTVYTRGVGGGTRRGIEGATQSGPFTLPNFYQYVTGSSSALTLGGSAYFGVILWQSLNLPTWKAFHAAPTATEVTASTSGMTVLTGATVQAQLGAADVKFASATSTATPSTPVARDASGRFAAATPSATGDVATKGYVDGLAASVGEGVPTYASGYTNQSGFEVHFEKFGKIVVAEGLSIRTAGDWAASTAYASIYTIPAGYRPKYEIIVPAGATTGQGAASFFIHTTGLVDLRVGPTAISGWVSIAGASWVAP